MNVFITNLKSDSETVHSAAYDKYAAELLCRQRYEKYKAFKSEKAAYESLAAGLLLQTGLERLYGIGKNELEFEYTDKEKPYLKGRKDICFSISHTEEFAGVAIGSIPLGFDAECAGYSESADKIKLDEKNLKVAYRFFSEDEMHFLEKCDDKSWCFRELWSMKESYMKLTGLGFSKTLDSFSVSYIPDEYDKNGMLTGYVYEHEDSKKKAAILKCFRKQETAFSVCCPCVTDNTEWDITVEEITMHKLTGI